MHPIIAYIDPGAGSLAIQALIAALVAAPIILRQQFARFLRRVRGDQAVVTVSAPDTDRSE